MTKRVVTSAHVLPGEDGCILIRDFKGAIVHLLDGMDELKALADGVSERTTAEETEQGLKITDIWGNTILLTGPKEFEGLIEQGEKLFAAS